MDKLVSIRAFCLVAERQSFTSAAQALDISPAMMSKHIASLEKQLGVRLLNRTSRNVSLTEAGTTYLEEMRLALNRIDKVEALITDAQFNNKGKLRLTAPVWFASDKFVSLIRDFQGLYPNIHLELNLSGGLINLIEEGYDLALRCSPKLGDHYRAKPICEIKFKFVASPAYIKKYGEPQEYADLQKHQLLWYPSIPKNTGEFNADFPVDNRTASPMKLEPALICDNESFLYLAAKKGMGIALLPELVIEQDLRDGSLQVLMDQKTTNSLQMMAVYANKNYLAPKIRRFIDFLAASQQL